jgi:hypothetical protein
VFEIDEGIAGPQPRTQFLPRDDLPWAFQQHRQNLEWLFLEPNSRSAFA